MGLVGHHRKCVERAVADDPRANLEQMLGGVVDLPNRKQPIAELGQVFAELLFVDRFELVLQQLAGIWPNWRGSSVTSSTHW